MSNPTGFSRLQIILHWLIAVLIGAQFLFGDYISEAWYYYVKTGSFDFNPLIAAHVFGGILILPLLIWRLIVRFTRGVPATPEGEHPAMVGIAHLTQWSLYALMIIMPVSGALAWFGDVRTSAVVHNVAQTPMIIFLVLHIGGALFHQFILKDNLIGMMKTPKD